MADPRINVRLSNSQTGTRKVVDVASGATVADLLRAESIDPANRQYSVTWRASAALPPSLLTPESYDSTTLSDMSEVFVTFVAQKGG